MIMVSVLANEIHSFDANSSQSKQEMEIQFLKLNVFISILIAGRNKKKMMMTVKKRDMKEEEGDKTGDESD